ncbi:MAG: FtsK/SpoIIIE domain-containing protein [Bacilli bacterium]
MTKEVGLLEELSKSIRFLWRHRKGNEVVGAILDTFDNLGFVTKDNRRPLLIHKRKTLHGWHLTFSLPPGISFASVKAKREYFQDASHSWITFSWNGVLQMDVQCGLLPTSVPFEWNPNSNPEMALPVPIGTSQRGTEVFDLAESPHLLIAGVPGFGKSNFLHVLIHALLPKAFICVIDLKRLEFAYLRKYAAIARNEGDALEMMQALNEEMERRIDILEKADVVKIQQYQGEMPYIVLVIDELAEIKDENLLGLIDRIVRLARAVGISVVASTQRPSTKVVSGDTRAMFAARLCFQVADELNSRMILGETCPLAAYLPGVKGRAIWKFGLIEREVQAMYLPIDEAKKRLKKAKGVRYELPKRATKRLPPR